MFVNWRICACGGLHFCLSEFIAIVLSFSFLNLFSYLFGWS